MPGDEPCPFVLIFDNGYFSEFGTFSITDWVGHTPKALLAKNFGVPASTFDGFPQNEVYFAQGALPPAHAAAPLAGAEPGPRTHKYRLLADDPRVNSKGGRLWRCPRRFATWTRTTNTIMCAKHRATSAVSGVITPRTPPRSPGRASPSRKPPRPARAKSCGPCAWPC
jgi:oxalate decarboxylase